MAQIFISHSQRDTIGRNWFNNYFAECKHKPFWYSWKGPRPPHQYSLLEGINESIALFVVLHEDMKLAYTASWVGYEIGIATKQGLDVFVFEPYEKNITFPVPKVDHYLIYDPRRTDRISFYYELINNVELFKNDATLPEGIQPTTGLMIKCPNEACRSRYRIYQQLPKINCPVCRTEYPTNLKPNNLKLLQHEGYIDFITRMKQDEMTNGFNKFAEKQTAALSKGIMKEKKETK